MPERGSSGFNQLQELVGRMKDADPVHASGWEEVSDIAKFLVGQGKISRTAKDPSTEAAKPLIQLIYNYEHFDVDLGGHDVYVDGKKAHFTMQNFRLLNW